ncbi:hypothetical protein Pcinc_027097 [Petrolisthes cinctipes]|uniref:Uncharacterized protein n=1 Tax=Petrolisthes cinctipes TaxID=88211 RepID=A0AAE1F5R5_PETCI|nr:hypothetical protein Pcinc_027097 [Petrolisthes cinctipes]
MALLRLPQCYSTCPGSRRPSRASRPAVPDNIVKALTDLKASTPLLRHVPRRDCHRVVTELAAHIHSAIEEQTVAVWYRLLSYAYKGLCASATTSNNSSKARAHGRDAPEHPLTQTLSNRDLTRGIRNKFADGDIKGTLHLLTTSDSSHHT